MVCRLTDLALIVLTLLVFKVCVSIGISKIEFFNFFGTERLKKKKKNQKHLKIIPNPSAFNSITFQAISTNSQIFSLFH